MRKCLISLAIFILPVGANSQDNPLLTAPSTDVSKWTAKLKKFEKPRLPKTKGYPKPFHVENRYVYKMKDVCSSCHTFAAHKKDRKYAPFYNAHGTFMSCNVCHFVKEGVTYSWAELKDGKVVLLKNGDFYGLKYVRVGDKVTLSGEGSTAKIVPVFKGVPVEIPVKGNEELLNDAKAVASMHNALSKRALECEDCHKENGAIDFKSLGFSPQRVKDLEHNEIVKGLKEYKSIHFPKFIW